MVYNIGKSAVRQLDRDDPEFTIIENMMVYERASLRIEESCPEHARSMILHALGQGWLKPIANVLDRELAFDILVDKREQ
jgi:hypothetical protein